MSCLATCSRFLPCHALIFRDPIRSLSCWWYFDNVPPLMSSTFTLPQNSMNRSTPCRRLSHRPSPIRTPTSAFFAERKSAPHCSRVVPSVVEGLARSRIIASAAVMLISPSPACRYISDIASSRWRLSSDFLLRSTTDFRNDSRYTEVMRLASSFCWSSALLSHHALAARYDPSSVADTNSSGNSFDNTLHDTTNCLLFAFLNHLFCLRFQVIFAWRGMVSPAGSEVTGTRPKV